MTKPTPEDIRALGEQLMPPNHRLVQPIRDLDAVVAQQAALYGSMVQEAQQREAELGALKLYQFIDTYGMKPRPISMIRVHPDTPAKMHEMASRLSHRRLTPTLMMYAVLDRIIHEYRYNYFKPRWTGTFPISGRWTPYSPTGRRRA